MVCILSLVLAFATNAEFGARGEMRRAATACDTKNPDSYEKTDCWLELATDSVRKGDISGAFGVFAYLYNTYPYFGASGCHLHAHRLGDAAYYEYYVVQDKSLADMELPQETTSCGYGFFHGFIEHLIQDRPDPTFVTKNCEYLRERLSPTMRDIATICYHASGHGFIQSMGDTLPRKSLGNINAIVTVPLNNCEKLQSAGAGDTEDCRQGVFNVLSDWMSVENFGLTYDFAHPFKVCDALIPRWQHACYYELGQKLEPVTGDSPIAAAKYVRDISDARLRLTTFGVMVAGMMQRASPLGTEAQVLDECKRVGDSALREECIHSMTNGMMEHGSPGKEYVQVLSVCNTLLLEKEDVLSDICFSTALRSLNRFYTPEKKLSICEEFPMGYRASCGGEQGVRGK